MAVEAGQVESIGLGVALATDHRVHVGHLRVQVGGRVHGRLMIHVHLMVSRAGVMTAAVMVMVLTGTAAAASTAHVAARAAHVTHVTGAVVHVAAAIRRARLTAAAALLAIKVLLAESVTDVQAILLEHEVLFFETQHLRRVVLVVVRDEAVAARVASLVRYDARVFHVTKM